MSTKMEIDNSGENTGAIVGSNTGTININPKIIPKIPSIITNVVKSLADNIPDDIGNQNNDVIPFNIKEKISYNNIKRYRPIINEYSIYYTYCDDILNTHDNSNIGSKNKVLRCIKTWYLEAKGIFTTSSEDNYNEMELVRINSDVIIDYVKDRVETNIGKSVWPDNMNAEEIVIGIYCFICYCFMECKILEKPK